MTAPVVIVVPVYRNGATLPELVRRIDAALTGPWRLRLVVDACPDGSAVIAERLAAEDYRVRITVLPRNVGQHAATVHGLREECDGSTWVCMDGDLQDPPEAVPLLLAEFTAASAAGVFAGRTGSYQSAGRSLTGQAHRRVLHALTGMPADAGAFLAMDARLRAAALDAFDRRRAPSVVAAAGMSRLPLTSIPVVRAERAVGASAWTSRARLRQAARTLGWTTAARVTELTGARQAALRSAPEPGRNQPGPPAATRGTYMRKRTAAAILAATVATGAGAAVSAPGLALAATSDPSSSSSATDRAAARLTAIKDALKGLVSDGTLNQSQADKVADTLSKADIGGGHGHGRGDGLSPTAVAQALGITEQELRDAQSQGKTLTQIAQGKGISRDDLIAKLKAAATTQLDADLKAGKITQAQHDQQVAGLDQRLAQRVDSVRQPHGPKGGGGQGTTASPTPTA